MSAYGLTEQLQIDQHSARRYMDQTCELARQQGYVETLFGRRLHLPGIKGKGPIARVAERQAINAPLQGTAADIIKRAMIDVQNMLKGRGDEAKMLLQVPLTVVASSGANWNQAH